MDASPDTFFVATAVPHSTHPRLTLDIDTGVCIVGAGFAGLWTARALLQRGYDVVVLEAGRVGGGASGRNGGFCSTGYGQELDVLVERVGLDHTRALYQLSREGVEKVHALIADGAPGLDPQPGRLSVLRYDDEDELRHKADDCAERFGHEMTVWPTERVRETLKSDCYYQALHDAEALNLNPLNLLYALAAEVEKGGGRIYEQSRAIAADLDGVRKWVATDKARVRAHQVVFCGSAAIGPGFPELARAILPVATHLAITAPLGEKLQEAIAYGGGVADARRAFDYYRVVGDRLLWGGYLSMRAPKPDTLKRKIARDILAVYPQLEGLQMEHAWSGVMGWAVHRMPQIGMLRPGVWVATAFGGQGINTAAIAGDLIASAIAENDDRWRLFIPFGLVWAGNGLGRLAIQGMYWSSVTRDWFDETLSKREEERREQEVARVAENARLEELARKREEAKPLAQRPKKPKKAKAITES